MAIDFCNSLPIVLSMVGIMLSANSIKLTFEPKRAYTEPSSAPITPAPITIKCFGTSVIFKASVDVIIRFLSTGIKGKIVGLEPVAMMMCFPDKISELPSSLFTFTVLAESKEPKPWKVLILFFFIKNEIPPFIFSTTPVFRAIICFKLTLGLGMSMPCSSK